MAYGHEYGLVIIDIVQKICVFNMKTQDIYFVQDPQFRNVRSPKKFSQTEEPEKYDETVQFNQSIDYVSFRLFFKIEIIDLYSKCFF